jgi:hypothetical protein
MLSGLGHDVLLHNSHGGQNMDISYLCSEDGDISQVKYAIYE